MVKPTKLYLELREQEARLLAELDEVRKKIQIESISRMERNRQRMREVLHLSSRGKSNREIGEMLGVTAPRVSQLRKTAKQLLLEGRL